MTKRRPKISYHDMLKSRDDAVANAGSQVPPTAPRVSAHPEKNFYIAGVKSYGRAPTFLMLTGYEQVRSIVSALSIPRR